MSNIIHADIFGTTANPCPAWCELAPGHGYDSNDHTAEYRFHERSVGGVDEPIPDGGRVRAHVQLVAAEALRIESTGTSLTLRPTRIVLDAQDCWMTSSQATEMARLLLQAVAMLDELTTDAS